MGAVLSALFALFAAFSNALAPSRSPTPSDPG
jgi:hypothetical protein